MFSSLVIQYWAAFSLLKDGVLSIIVVNLAGTYFIDSCPYWCAG